jgi:thiamine biosynthesis protein ThiS
MTTATITINGTPFTHPIDSLEAVLTELNFLKRWSAVEVNGEILPRDVLTQRNIANNDTIEVVSPVGGGQR